VANHAFGSCRDSLRYCFSQRLKDHFRETKLRLPPADYREGFSDVYHGAFWGDHPDVSVETCIHWNIGVNQTFQHESHARVCLRVSGIYWRWPLRVGASEIEQHPFVIRDGFHL